MRNRTEPVLIVGNAYDCPDFEYASGFRAPDPAVFLAYGRKRFLVVSTLEVGRARRTTTAEVLTPDGLGLQKSKRKRLRHWALMLLKREGITRVRIPPTFSYAIGRSLEKAGITLIVKDGALFPERAVKTLEEQQKIRAAQQAGVIAMRAAVSLIAHAGIDQNGWLTNNGKSLTSEDIRRAIAVVLLEHGCVCRETIVAGGQQSADPHEIGHGVLRAHEPIVIDIFPQQSEYGYWGDLTRTVVRGRASRRLKRMYYAVHAAQKAALATIRPGAQCRKVHQNAAREIERRGFPTRLTGGRGEGFIHSTGHGVGLEIHEGPLVGPVGTRLRAGNVITVEPGLYYGDIGGVRIEDTVVVTQDGWRYLVPCEKRFEI